MTTQSLLGSKTEGGEVQQLVARASDVWSRPCVLNGGASYPKGCLVMATTPAADFVKVIHGALPADTDVVGIVSEEVDATGGDTKATIYIHGEFYKDTVFRASADDLTASDVAAIIETCIAKGINIVAGAYDTFVPAA